MNRSEHFKSRSKDSGSMNEIHKALLLVLFVFIFAGCSVWSNTSEGIPPNEYCFTKHNHHFDITPFVKATATATISMQTSILIPTETVTKSQVTPREVNCFQLAFDNVAPIKTEGMIVFSGEFYHSSSYLLDIQSGKKIPLGQSKDEKLTGFAVSTDQKWLAYQKINTQLGGAEIQIAASNGKVVKAINWEKSWRKIVGWVNGQTLLISKNRGENEIDSIITLNPFTGQQHEILPNYPKMWIIWAEKAFTWGSFNTSGTIYNSDLTRVIYPISDEQKSGVVLWSLPDQKEVVSLFGGFGNQPKWSPNQEGFIINLSVRYQGNTRTNEELFYVDKAGKVRQVTNLNEADGEASIGFFNWSPDGKAIAFWLSIEQDDNYPDIYPNSPADYPNRLAILNLVDGKVMDSCLPGDLNLSPPVWSLTGQYIAIEDYYDLELPFNGRVFLVDLLKGIAIKIAENVTPIGWMQSSQ